MFEFEGELYWKAKCTKADDDRSQCQGKLKILEFAQDDVDDDELNTEVICEKSGPWVDGVKQVLRKQVTHRLLYEAKKLTAAMKENDIDEHRLAQKKAEAATATEEYKEA